MPEGDTFSDEVVQGCIGFVGVEEASCFDFAVRRVDDDELEAFEVAVLGVNVFEIFHLYGFSIYRDLGQVAAAGAGALRLQYHHAS